MAKQKKSEVKSTEIQGFALHKFTVFLLVLFVAEIPIFYYIYKDDHKVESPLKVEEEEENTIVTQQLVQKLDINEMCFEKQLNVLRYWGVCLSEWHDAGSLRTMNRVFKRMNYEFVNRSNGDEWDILWSIEHPLGTFDDDEDLSLFADVRQIPLEKHQKVNHFPGIGILITKIEMNENNRDSKYILPFFDLPYDDKELEKYIEENPHKNLLVKNIFNRGVKIIEASEIDHTEDNEIFYQEFMDRHFLIDGHAFDFGVFALITSFDPVRVYRFEGDILLRFCPTEYHPFDPKVVDKYVVQEGCLSPYEMPSIKKIYDTYQYTIQSIFEKIIKDKGYSVEKFWSSIDDAMSSIILNSEDTIMEKVVRKNFSTHNFFEVVRFDFVLDEDLRPYVLEVNMSPNLTPALKKFENNALIYEQLVYNTIKMIGGGSYHEFYAR